MVSKELMIKMKYWGLSQWVQSIFYEGQLQPEYEPFKWGEWLLHSQLQPLALPQHLLPQVWPLGGDWEGKSACISGLTHSTWKYYCLDCSELTTLKQMLICLFFLKIYLSAMSYLL